MPPDAARPSKRPLGPDLGKVAVRSLEEFFTDRAPQLAAAISYYVLFSIFPLAIVVVSAAGLLVDEQTVRTQVIDQLIQRLGLVGRSADEVGELLQSALTGFGALGLLGLLGLLWTASGVMTSLRSAINTAFDVDDRRPVLTGKALDILFVIAVAPLFAASLTLTFLVQQAGSIIQDIADRLAGAGALAEVGLRVLPVLASIAFSFFILVLVFRAVPARRTHLREVWVGALIAAVLLELAKNALALYFRYFGNYDLVYGSLGAVISFMFFVFIAANILLLGAEAASEWPRVRAGRYDHDEGGPGLRRRLAKELVGIGGRDEDGERPEGRGDKP